MTAHDISDFIDSIKDSLTDAQYKEGMEICQKVFHKKEETDKLYMMTYLRPHTFIDDHCDDEDCDDMKFLIGFNKVSNLIRLSDERAERIKYHNVFSGTDEEMKQFLDLDILLAFPCDASQLDSDFQWYEFPVLSLDLVEKDDDL